MQDEIPAERLGIPAVRMEIGPSTHLIGQLGLIALDRFNPGDVVVPVDLFGDETYHSWAEFQNFSPATQRKIMDFCIGDENGFYAPPDLNNLSASWYMNHSCSPNVGFDQNDNAIAIGEILPGDELVYDYAIAESNPNFSFICMCGSSTCRGRFSGEDWRRLPSIMTRYHSSTSLMRSRIYQFLHGKE
jgi:hypothetical protein